MMIAYNAAILVWFGYMWAPSPVKQASPGWAASERWDEGLATLHQPAYPESLIPMFEGMVDRAFSRTEEQPATREEQEPDREPKSTAHRLSRPATEITHRSLYTAALPFKV